MSQLTDQHTPTHLEGTPPTTRYRALSALARVTQVALLGTALAYTAYLVLFAVLLHHVFVPAILIFSIAPILAAGLVATRWRWTLAVRAALVLLISTLFFAQPLLQYYLTHPAYRPACFFVGLLVAANPQASGASTATTGEPTVHLGADNFVQQVVRLTSTHMMGDTY